MNALQDAGTLSGGLNTTGEIESRMSSTGWDNSHPLRFKCTFCNLYFRTEEEKEKHVEEKHSDY
jgi:hypothetical protein